MAHDTLEQIDRHLQCANLAWLFGAGISRDGNIPLMKPLTERVVAVLKMEKASCLKLIETLAAELPDDAHVEQILSHLGDYTALAERSRDKSCNIGGKPYKIDAIAQAHQQVVSAIADIIRWGYRSKSKDLTEETGAPGNSIVCVKGHQDFVSAVYNSARAGLEKRRGPVKFFTTNYDTLLEDALAIEAVPYWDGFSGGAVAHRNYHFGQREPISGFRAHVIKLHGSIDWHLVEEGRVLRVRDGDGYPQQNQRVLIYPQSTKYTATQKDPFAAQFDMFRRTFSERVDNVLAICGYSFMDNHVNDEIVHGMRHPDSKTTLIAFSSERPEYVEQWQTQEPWGQRVYAVTEQGIYVGDEPLCHPPAGAEPHTWWKFDGVARLMTDGAESFL